MSADPAWAFFVLVALAWAVARLPLFRAVDSPPDGPQHFVSVDGLRGFLALAVFVYHLVVTHRFIDDGVWQAPDSRFQALLGPIGVSMFFMITGFLFWGKLLRCQGAPRWLSLYIGRLMRIGPLYLAVVVAMLVIVALRTGLQLHDPAQDVLSSVLRWLALGVLDSQPDVNGYPARHVLAGVTWTIHYEWLFYASLLVIAPFARGRRHGVFVAIALVTCVLGKLVWHMHSMGLAALFLYGMAVASLLHEPRWRALSQRLSPRQWSMLVLACMVAVFAVPGGGYGSLVGALLALAFGAVCTGATLFGLLTSAPARRLGAISYGLYLMQGLVLTLVFAIAPLRSAAIASVAVYWAAGAACLLLLLLAALAAHLAIERPGIALGVRWARQLRGRAARGAPLLTSR